MSTNKNSRLLTIGEVRKTIRRMLNEDDSHKQEYYSLIKKRVENWKRLNPAKQIEAVENSIEIIGEDNEQDIIHFFDAIFPKTDDSTIKILADKFESFKKYIQKKESAAAAEPAQHAEIASAIEQAKESGLKTLFKSVLKNANEKRKLTALSSLVDDFIDNFVSQYDKVASFADEHFPENSSELIDAALNKPIADEMKKRATTQTESVSRFAFKKEVNEVRLAFVNSSLLEEGIFDSIVGAARAQLKGLMSGIDAIKDKASLAQFQKMSTNLIKSFVNGYAKLSRNAANSFPDKYEDILAKMIEIPVSTGIRAKISAGAGKASSDKQNAGGDQQQQQPAQNDASTTKDEVDEEAVQHLKKAIQFIKNERFHKRVFEHGEIIFDFFVRNAKNYTKKMSEMLEDQYKSTGTDASPEHYAKMILKQFAQENAETILQRADSDLNVGQLLSPPARRSDSKRRIRMLCRKKTKRYREKTNSFSEKRSS